MAGRQKGRQILRATGALLLALAVAACSGGAPQLADVTGAKGSPNAPVPAPIPQSVQPNSIASVGAVTLGTPGPDLVTGSAAAIAPTAKVKVALLLPLSGPGQTAIIAQELQRAAELAIADMRATQIELIVRDDKGTPEGALAAANEVTAAGVELVLGPVFSKSVAAAASVTRAKSVPMIAFSNDRLVAGQGVSLLSFFAGQEVQRVIGYAAAQGKKRFAAFVPDDVYGREVEARFREAVARAGGTIVALKQYPVDNNGRATPVLEQLKALRLEMRGVEEHGERIDAILIPGGPETVALVSPLLKQVDIDPQTIKILGTGALDAPNVGRDAMFVGAWFASSDPRGFKDFSEKYGRAHGHAPPRIAALGYDAAAIAAALSNAPPGARYIPSALTRLAGFNGVEGLFRLTAEGPVERALAVLEVRELGAQIIEAAPQSLDVTLAGRVN